MSYQAPERLPTYADVMAAATRLAGHAVRTPLLNAPLLDEITGCRTLVKPEMLQRTGSFKFRGAFNRMSMIPQEDRHKGVIAFSSGNHAQGVACAARDLGMSATIVMPADAPAIKIENTRAYGADVRLYDRYREDREKIGKELAAGTGATLVKPYDDLGIIAGQGTVGLEIAEQAAEIGHKPDIALVCCGGGGLSSGTALALKHDFPAIEIYSVEPAGFDDTARSLARGERVENEPGSRSICDALLASTPGEMTFALNSQHLSAGLSVTDEEVLQAMAVAFRTLKVVAEPGGAVALAAVLAGRIDVKGKTVAVVMSGGNVDPARFQEALAS